MLMIYSLYRNFISRVKDTERTCIFSCVNLICGFVITIVVDVIVTKTIGNWVCAGIGGCV